MKKYKTLMKEMKGINKWKDSLCYGIRRLNTIKMIMESKVIYRFNAILIKIPIAFCRNRKTYPKINMKS